MSEHIELVENGRWNEPRMALDCQKCMEMEQHIKVMLPPGGVPIPVNTRYPRYNHFYVCGVFAICTCTKLE